MIASTTSRIFRNVTLNLASVFIFAWKRTTYVRYALGLFRAEVCHHGTLRGESRELLCLPSLVIRTSGRIRSRHHGSERKRPPTENHQGQSIPHDRSRKRLLADRLLGLGTHFYGPCNCLFRPMYLQPEIRRCEVFSSLSASVPSAQLL